MKDIQTMQLQDFLDHAGQGFASFDVSGQLRAANQLAQRFAKHGEPLSWMDLCPPHTEWAHIVDARLTASMLRHYPITWHTLPNDQDIWVHIGSPTPWQTLNYVSAMVWDTKHSTVAWANPPMLALLQCEHIKSLNDLEHIKWSTLEQSEYRDPPWHPNAQHPEDSIYCVHTHDDADTLYIRVDVQSNQHISYMICEDITHHVRSKQQHQELLSIASHELRNPLTPLKGLLQLAIDQVESGEQLDYSLLHRADTQVSRLIRLTNTLLDASRIDTQRFTTSLSVVDLRDVVDGIIDIWSTQHQRHTFELSLSTRTCSVEIDVSAIEQVINNLIDNAIKFSPEHSNIEISLRTFTSQALLSVTDQGDGIPKALQPHIFDQFYRSPHHAKTKGMGLGLYVSQNIVRELGGEVFVDSAKGGPTSFTIAIPTVNALNP